MEYHLQYLTAGYLDNVLTRNLLVALSSTKRREYLSNIEYASYYTYKIEDRIYRVYEDEIMQIKNNRSTWTGPHEYNDTFSYSVVEECIDAYAASPEDIVSSTNVYYTREYLVNDSLVFKLSYSYSKNEYITQVYRVLEDLLNYDQYLVEDMELLNSLI